MNKPLFLILLLVLCGILSLLVVFTELALIKEHVLLWSIAAVVLAVVISLLPGRRKRTRIGNM